MYIENIPLTARGQKMLAHVASISNKKKKKEQWLHRFRTKWAVEYKALKARKHVALKLKQKQATAWTFLVRQRNTFLNPNFRDLSSHFVDTSSFFSNKLHKARGHFWFRISKPCFETGIRNFSEWVTQQLHVNIAREIGR